MTGIIILILIGLFLFVVEFLLIPGITVAGIAGVGCLIGGIFWAYSSHGNMVGHITLVSTIAITLFTIALALRSRTWNKFMLNTNIDGSVASDEATENIKQGDTGFTISRLTPMGKVRINDIVLEAKSTGEYIDPKTEISVIRFEGSKVIVKPKIN
jgi:membrane-bound ClpP family serine protease